MANGTQKTRVLNRLFSITGKNGHAEEPATRPVLEQLIYAVLREGTTQAKADEAFRALQTSFFDWNEIRVSMIREVADVIQDLPNPEDRAARIISILQEVFETTYSFDLEPLHKKGLKMAEKQLQRYQAANTFIVSYTVQTGLGGHALPLDDAMIRVLRRLEVLDGELDEAARTSLEHFVPKSKGVQFCEALSQVAHEYCHENNPKCNACPLHDSCPSAQVHATRTRSAARIKAR
jgi:endonuclease-3